MGAPKELGLTPERCEFLLINSKWYGRFFKSITQMYKEAGTDNYEGLGRYYYGFIKYSFYTSTLNAMSRCKQATSFENVMREEGLFEAIDYMMGSKWREGMAPQEVFDNHFCEEMFEPEVKTPKVKVKLDRPLAQKVLAHCKWFQRIFKLPKELNSTSDAYIPVHLRYILDCYNNYITLESAMDKVYEASPDNWIELMTDFLTDAKGNLVYNIDLLEQRFNERMFIKPPAIPLTKPAVPKKTMLNQSSESVEFIPVRPELCNETAQIIFDYSDWGDRIFRSVSVLKSKNLDHNFNFNLWSALSVYPLKTFEDIMLGIRRSSPITWNGIIADLSWNENLRRYQTMSFDSKFTEDMFMPITKVQDSNAPEEISIDWDQFDEDSLATVPKSTKTKLISPEKISAPLKIRGKKVSLINTNSVTLLNIKSNGTKAKN